MDINPFDNNSNLSPAEVAGAALLAIASRGAYRMPIKGVLRPKDFIVNRDLVNTLRSGVSPMTTDVLKKSEAAQDLTRKMKSEDLRTGLSQNPNVRSTVIGSDGLPMDVFQQRSGAPDIITDIVPRDVLNITRKEGTITESQTARDLLNFMNDGKVNLVNQQGSPFRGIKRNYTVEDMPEMIDELVSTATYNYNTPQLAALQAMRETYGSGPLAQIRFIRDTRALAKPRKELRAEVKDLARSLDTPIETPAAAYAILSPQTTVAGMRNRMQKVLEGVVRPEKKVTNEGRFIKREKENILLNRALDRLVNNNIIPLPTKTGSLARALSGEAEIVLDDADILRMLGPLDNATLANIRNNPALIERIRSEVLKELTKGTTGDILKSTALSSDPFYLQAILRGRY